VLPGVQRGVDGPSSPVQAANAITEAIASVKRTHVRRAASFTETLHWNLSSVRGVGFGDDRMQSDNNLYECIGMAIRACQCMQR
jgi:hypothetical protein